MKIETEALLVRQRHPTGWAATLAVLGFSIAAILAIYWQTARSIVTTWDSSVTYTHGYAIVPIVLFLVWRVRHDVAQLVPRPDVLGLVLLACAGFVWLGAAAANVQVVQQYAVVSMIPAAVLALAGRDVARALAFPFAFLLFAVPSGDAFVPRLMDWTADFTVAALRLTGIPVFREGTFFQVPSGHWSVVEACSGIRYLIASLTVGTLYAYLTYTKLWKRALFIGFSIVVPVFANFLRAYIIVMIGHLSSMRLAVGVDHLIYGWIFFGIVIFALFWGGSFWRDPVPASLAPKRRVALRQASPASRFALAFGAVVVLAAVWPLYAAHLGRDDAGKIGLATPVPAGAWALDTASLTDWRPNYSGGRASVFQVYGKGERKVALYVGYYRGQRQGAELVGWQNSIAGHEYGSWERVGERGRQELLAGAAVDLRETHLRSARQRLLVWDWYRIAGRDTSNPYFAKALLARDRLLQRGDDSAAIILAAPYTVRADVAEQTLREFASDMLPAIGKALEQAKRASP